MDVVRTLLQASRSPQVRRVVESAPLTRAVVRRYVAGEAASEAIAAAAELLAGGLTVSLDHLGEDARDLESARVVRDAYLLLISALQDAGLAAGGRAEVSVRLSGIGQALGADGEKIALEHAHEICTAASLAGTTVTLDMEDHTTTDSTLSVLQALRADFAWVGAVLQAQLRRTEGDCAALATPGSRVRLCKGAYDEPESVAHREAHEVDLAYVRCARILMAGQGYPMLATHDPRLIDIGGALAVQNHRPQGTYEFQLLYGVRTAEQRRLADDGESVRVYLPYGVDGYGYVLRRLVERPQNIPELLRSLLARG